MELLGQKRKRESASQIAGQIPWLNPWVKLLGQIGRSRMAYTVPSSVSASCQPSSVALSGPRHSHSA